jgi:F-type H+-transporting ATPase subunit a
MRLSPDQIVYWQHGWFKLNATIVTTWAIIIVLVIGAKLITRNLKTGIHISHWQSLLEIIVLGIKKQIAEVGLTKPEKYIGFLGTLFLFIAISNICVIVPGYEPPTASLSTTAALAFCVFVAVPAFGIRTMGWKEYMRSYLKPTFIMLPFNIISEFSRTLALAVRLFGNIMSGSMMLAILLLIVPFFFPIITNILGLLTGVVQAYIFSILATVYIAAAIRSKK